MSALEGIRVVDFSWVLAGPALTRYLGDYGAEVIKVESHTHPDVIRTSPPYRDGKPGLSRSGYWANYHANKYGISVNVNQPKGLEVVKKLLATSDIVVENYIPGTMDAWGIGYEDLRKLKPDIIMVSISLYGQTGPYARRGGWGAYAEGMSGLASLIGWPDRVASGFQGVIGDAVVPFFCLSAVLAALQHRENTGEGQHLDVCQLDVCGYLLAPLLLDYQVNRREATRNGNRAPGSAPQGVYPCAGDDRWCAISVTGDEEWCGLGRALSQPAWCGDTRFATFAGREANQDELDALVAARTVDFPPEVLMHLLQREGVPAGAVLNGQGVSDDPQLRHRGALSYGEHPEIGRTGYYNAPFKLSLTPAELRKPAPGLGEHTEYVCTRLLGMSTDEFVQLHNEGVFD